MNRVGIMRLLITCLLASSIVSILSTPPVLAQSVDGEILGGVVDATGRPLANQRLELHPISGETRRRVVRTSDAQGTFTYQGLGPGCYEIELVIGGRVVARTRPVELSAGAMRVMGLTLTRPAVWVRSNRRVTALPRLNAKQLLGTQGVAGSFEALQAVLKPGHRVVFGGRESSVFAMAFGRGGLWSGREVIVAEVARDRLTLLRRRWFRTEEIVLTEDAVRRVDIVDPIRKGVLVGAAVGGVLGAALALDTRRYTRSNADCNLCPLGYIISIVLPVMGGGVGGTIDHMINEPVYRREAHAPSVGVVPLLGRGAIGVSGYVRF